MSKPDGGPAFPLPAFPINSTMLHNGMSLRDWLAGMALQGTLAGGSECTVEVDAKFAYRMADAMLAERAKP